MVVRYKPCSFKDCPYKVKAEGLCHSHYAMKRRTGKLLPIGYRNNPTGICLYPGCTRKSSSRKMCNMHYIRVMASNLATEDQRSCLVPGCKIRHYAKDMCFWHYMANSNISKNQEVSKLLEDPTQ